MEVNKKCPCCKDTRIGPQNSNFAGLPCPICKQATQAAETLEPTLDEQIAYQRGMRDQCTLPSSIRIESAILSSLERLKVLERVAANVLLDEPHEVHDISPARVSRRAWKELQDAVGSKPKANMSKAAKAANAKRKLTKATAANQD